MKQVSNIVQPHTTDFTPLPPQPIVLNLNKASHRAGGKNAAPSNRSLTTDPRVTSPGHRVSRGQGLPLLWPHQTRPAWTSALPFTPAQQRLLQLTQQDVPVGGEVESPGAEMCTVLIQPLPAGPRRRLQLHRNFAKLKIKLKKGGGGEIASLARVAFLVGREYFNAETGAGARRSKCQSKRLLANS